MALFDPSVTALSVLGYGLSWLELLGVLTGLASVLLAGAERPSTWTIGIVNNLFFFILFKANGLYSDMLLQIFFAVVSLWGLWRWLRPKKEEANGKGGLRISSLKPAAFAGWLGLAALGIAALTLLVSNLHILLPSLFTSPAAFPLADSVVAVLSVVATFLMGSKRVQCWWCWIFVDILATAIYAAKGVAFLSMEYAVFGVICAFALRSWMREMTAYAPSAPGAAAAGGGAE